MRKTMAKLKIIPVWIFYCFQIVLSVEFCPTKCECDTIENLNRALCRGQKLISASIDVPKNVQIFDLSENDITTLDNKCFEELSNVINLTISFNSIHSIYLDAFTPLTNVKSIDLSHNRLEYFDERIFENNLNLLELNLGGNKFMSLQNKPLFISLSVKYLSLKSSQITHIYPDVFELSPSLNSLDLSGNLMITLTMTPFKPLKKLKNVNLEGNRWICDKNIADVVKLLKRERVTIELDVCQFEMQKIMNGNGPKMFERMMMEVDEGILEEKISTTERPKTNIEMLWKNINSTSIMDKQCISSSFQDLCELYNRCIINYTSLEERYGISIVEKSSPHRNFFELINDNNLAFYFGMCIGAALVFVLVACSICAMQCMKGNNKNKFERNNSVTAASEFHYVQSPSSHQPLISLPPPDRRLPLIPRRQVIRRRQPIPPFNRSLSTPARRTTASVNQNDFATFITRLFERPARHQYHRTFNENTAHLIRRLSRSNLLNNRLSQHFIGEMNRSRNSRHDLNGRNADRSVTSSETGTSQETQTLIESNSNIDSSQVDRPVRGISRDSIEVYHGPTIQRPETPPPSYTDVVQR